MRQASDERVQHNRAFDGRLMRRYSLGTHVEIEWLSAKYRKGLRRRVVVPSAEVLDLSMGGMLVDAPGKPRLEIGAMVELASEGHLATARVAHKHVALDPGKQLLGIELVEMSEAFAASLHEAVRALRG